MVCIVLNNHHHNNMENNLLHMYHEIDNLLYKDYLLQDHNHFQLLYNNIVHYKFHIYLYYISKVYLIDILNIFHLRFFLFYIFFLLFQFLYNYTLEYHRIFLTGIPETGNQITQIPVQRCIKKK